MKDIILIAILLAIPFVNYKQLYEKIWERFSLFFPSIVEQYDTILRKKWSMIRTHHLFLFSFVLTLLSILFFFFGVFLNLPTVSLPIGIIGGRRWSISLQRSSFANLYALYVLIAAAQTQTCLPPPSEPRAVKFSRIFHHEQPPGVRRGRRIRAPP